METLITLNSLLDLNQSLFLPQIWLIIALGFLLLEMLDTSMVFFLPLSLAAVVMSLLNADFMLTLGAGMFLTSKWYWAASQWMLIGVLISFGLIYLKRWLRRRHKTRHSDDSGDINEY